jgi:hypothetical protein
MQMSRKSLEKTSDPDLRISKRHGKYRAKAPGEICYVWKGYVGEI